MAAMPAPAQTLGESQAHVPRHKIWMMAVFVQIVSPALITACLYGIVSPQSFRSFVGSAPWRLPLALSWGFYWSLLYLIMFYAELFLPRTPVAVAEKLFYVGAYGVGIGVITVMVSAVLVTRVKDGRVLAGCTAVVGVIIVGLAAFWVWLARTYGRDADSSEESTTPPPAEALEGQQPAVPPRLPV